MEKQEIITIIEALKNRQSWFRKSFQDLLDTWENATESGEKASFRYVRIAEKEREDGCGGEYFYIKMFYNNIYKCDWSLNMGQEEEEEVELDEIPIVFLRQIAQELPTRIAAHFKRTQSAIEKYDRASQGLIDLTHRLTD